MPAKQLVRSLSLLAALVCSPLAARATVSTYTLGNTGTKETYPSDVANLCPVAAVDGSGWPDAVYVGGQMVMPTAPSNPSPSGAFSGMFGLTSGEGGTPSAPVCTANSNGGNYIFAKFIRVPGNQYHVSWDMFWGNTDGSEGQHTNFLAATALPGDTVYWAWYGYGFGSLSWHAYITVTKPDGTNRAAVNAPNAQFVVLPFPNTPVYPSFTFTRDSTYSCTDMPGGGTLTLFMQWADVNGTYNGPVGSMPNSAPVCGLTEFTNSAAGTTTIGWTTH